MTTASRPAVSLERPKQRMAYQWRGIQTDYADHDVQRIGEALAEIADENEGTLHAKDVVASAQSKRSPLHPLFEWDDRTAARAHRLHQAERLVMAVVIATPDADRPSPAFVKTYSAKTPTFTTLQRAQLAAVEITDASGARRQMDISVRREKAQKLAMACGRLKRWQVDFGDLLELKPVIDAIEEQLAALDLCR